jgi:hypothetical protein
MSNESHSGIMEANIQSRFCEDFSLALHAMAQPLTVLRGTLGTLKHRGTSASDAERYLEMSHRQVERLCDLVSGMRNLLDTVQFDAVCTATNLWELTASMVDRERCSLQQRGTRISLAKTNGDVWVLADSVRTELAISAALRVLWENTASGDEISVCLSSHDGFAELAVHAKSAVRTKMNSADRLYLSLAEACIDSEHGHFRFTADPLSFEIGLPLCLEEGQRETEELREFDGSRWGESNREVLNTVS